MAKPLLEKILNKALLAEIKHINPHDWQCLFRSGGMKKQTNAEMAFMPACRQAGLRPAVFTGKALRLYRWRQCSERQLEPRQSAGQLGQERPKEFQF